jgi:uncharacterized LabA/DUF88 family protein
MVDSKKAPKKREVYAYIDSQNVNVTTQKNGWKMNWQQLRNFLRDKYGVTKAYMFIGYVPEFEAMYEQLHEQGYAIVLKPTFDMTRPRLEGEDRKDDRPIKGNIDAELVLWAMKDLPDYDKAIIVSGDGDFYCLVEYLDEQNKLEKIMPPTAHYSSLYNKYEKYVDKLENYKRQLEYHDRKKKFLRKNRTTQ